MRYSRFARSQRLVVCIVLIVLGSVPSVLAEAPQPMVGVARERFEFELIFDGDFSKPDTLDAESGLFRRESMSGSNNSGQHRQAPGRRHAAWYDQFHDKTAFVQDGVLVQRGYIADAKIDGFTSRDSGQSPRNFAYTDPDPRDASLGEVNFADFEIHTSWFDTFALKSVKGEQVPVEASDELLPQENYWGQPGKTDTRSPNIVFRPGTYFEIEVNFSGMQALAHRHSFWLMPAMDQKLAYDDNPANGLEIDIYEHELAVDRDAVSSDRNNPNEILLMKCIGGATTPPTTHNELAKDGNTSIHVPGINHGWHKIGLFWTKEMLVWIVDGKAVVRDRKLVPTVPMFMILSREANTGANRDGFSESLQVDGERIPMDAGLFGRNAATPANREKIQSGQDDVRVRSVRAWRISAKQDR